MRIDRSKKEPPTPPAPIWDNSGLRDRLEGRVVEVPDLEGLHAIARERDAEAEKPKRRFRRR